MMRNIPKQIHIFVVLAMIVLAVYGVEGIVLASYSTSW